MHLKSFNYTIVLFVFIILLNSIHVFGDDTFNNLIETGKYKEAITYAKDKLPLNKRTVDIWLMLGEAHNRSGSSQDEILACYTNAQKVNPSDPRIYLGLGKIYYSAKKYDIALSRYQRSYILERTAEAAEGIAMSAAKLKNWDKARDAAESAINLNPELFDSRLILANLYFIEKDYEETAKQLEFIVQKRPSSLKYWKRLSSCYEKLNKTEKLALIDPKIISLDRKDVTSRTRHAKYSLLKNDWKTAYTLYKELAILKPNKPDIFKNLYQIAFKQGSKDDAILYLKNYLALDSSNAESHKILGSLLFEKNNYPEALLSFRKALKIDPNIKGFYKQYESIVLKNNLKDEAVEVIKGAIAKGEADVHSYSALGNIYKEKKMYDQAIRMYREVLKTSTQDIKILTSLGECQAKTKDIGGAIVTYEQVVLLYPEATKEHKILGDLHMKLKKVNNAMNAYKKYLEKAPGDAYIAKIIGLDEYGKKKYDMAIKYLEMVKQPKLHDATYFSSLGQSYYQMKNYSKAADLFAKARIRKPPEATLRIILKQLGICYENTGDKTKAAEAYEAYTKISGVVDQDASYKQAFLREDTDKKTALAIYEANIGKFPKDHRNYLRLGMILSKSKNTLEKSATMLSKASQIVSKDPKIWSKLGEVYGKLNNDPKELSAYKRLLQIEPQNSLANKRVGMILMKKKQYSEAIVNLEMFITTNPNDVEVVEMLADGYLKTKRPGKAIDLLSKAKKLKSNDVTIRTKLIDACIAAGKKKLMEKEKKDLAELDKKIISKDPKNITSRNRLADYSYDNKDLNTAYKIYKELSHLTPKNEKVFKRLYEISLKNKQIDESIRYLRKYLNLDKNNARAYMVLGNLLYDKKEFSGALNSYRTALKINPKIKGFYKRYGEIVVSKGLTKEAIQVLNATIKAGEADNQTYIILGKLYQNTRSYKSAINMFRKASDADPKNSSILTSLAQCQAKNGNLNEAILTYQQVVLINPIAKDEYKALGNLQMKVNKKANAIESYKKYLSRATRDSKIANIIGLHEYNLKQYATAIEFLEKVSDIKLHNMNYLNALGQSYYHLKKYTKASLIFARMQKKKASVDILKQILKPLGECYENIGKEREAAETYLAYTKLPGTKDNNVSYKKAFLREKWDLKTAISMYNANIRVFKTDYRSFYRLGMIYSGNKKNLTKAATMLSSAHKLNPKDPKILHTLGQVYGKLSNTNKELAIYKKLLKLEPQNIEANRRVGMILLSNKKYSEAIINLEMVLTMNQGDVDLMMSLAEGYKKTNRPKKAIELLNKTKAIKKNDANLRHSLYKLYKKVGNKKGAETEVKELIELTKNNRFRTIYAEDLINEKRFDEALNLVKQVKSSDPTNVKSLMLQGKILQEQNKLDEAIETYKMISYIKENYAPALCERGNIYFKKNNVSRAKSYYEKTVAADKKYALGYLGLAKIAKKKDNNTAYLKYLKKAKTLDPQNEQILAESRR